MKLSSILVVVSFLASEALIAGARPVVEEASLGSLHRRAAQGKFNAGKGGAAGAANKGGAAAGANKTGAGAKGGKAAAAAGGKGAAKTTAAAAVTTSSAAAAAATTTAAAGKGGKGAAAAAGAAGGAAAGAAAASGAAAANDTAAAAASTANNSDLQTSLTLDPKLIGSNLALNGQATQEPGQVASLTSTNNFINFCDTTNQPITNGLQVTGGSCNPVPMGQIPSSTNVPSCKFTNPKNGDTIPANQNFTISLAVQNMDTGNFVNADTNYFGAPQQLNSAGLIVAHSHVVVEALTALDQTTPTNPTVFAFFKGLNEVAVDGILSATVAGGLPAGAYKVSSINTAANHQPVLGPVAQHGSFDDVAYFTVQ